MDEKQIITEEKIAVSWTTPEFTYHQKSSGWLAALAIITLALFAIAMLMQNYIFALLILLLSFLVYIQALRKPPKIKIVISEKGIGIQENFYQYKELKSFWLFDDPEIRILSVESKKSLLHHRIAIPLADRDPNEIRQLLIQFIPEKRQEEVLTDIIARKLKF